MLRFFVSFFLLSVFVGLRILFLSQTSGVFDEANFVLFTKSWIIQAPLAINVYYGFIMSFVVSVFLSFFVGREELADIRAGGDIRDLVWFNLLGLIVSLVISVLLH